MKNHKFPPVSVVVTVLNEAASILALLQALVQQTVLPTEVIIVDGRSHDRTVAIIQDFAAHSAIPITVLSQPGNRSKGRNVGISQVNTELIAITDAGCEPHSDWIEQLLRVWDAENVVQREKVQRQPIVVAGYYDAQPTTPLEEAIVPYALVMPDKVNPETFLPATRSMLIPKVAWESVGGFDEHLSDNEDYAFAHQLKGKAHIVFAGRARVTWQPRSSLKSFANMIFRFARGDIQAGLLRPKVALIFGRYILGFLIVWGLWSWHEYVALGVFLVVGLAGYSMWAILKNRRYVPHGWYWLPALQFMADFCVMSGSLAGVAVKWR